NIWSERYLHTHGHELPEKSGWIMAHNWSISKPLETQGIDRNCQEKGTASTTGFILKTGKRSLNHACDAAPSPGSPDSHCDWGYYEMFVPDISLAFCRSRHFLDYGTRRLRLVEHPNACLREVRPGGRVSPWRLWGPIGNVWCD